MYEKNNFRWDSSHPNPLSTISLAFDSKTLCCNSYYFRCLYILYDHHDDFLLNKVYHYTIARISYYDCITMFYYHCEDST